MIYGLGTGCQGLDRISFLNLSHSKSNEMQLENVDHVLKLKDRKQCQHFRRVMKFYSGYLRKVFGHFFKSKHLVYLEMKCLVDKYHICPFKRHCVEVMIGLRSFTGVLQIRFGQEPNTHDVVVCKNQIEHLEQNSRVL